MATTKDKIAVALGTAGLLTGALTFFQPPSPDPHERARNRMQDEVNNLADSHQREIERYRDAANDHAEAENERRTTPGEHRPPEPRIRIRVIP